jgi:hypothetical protein
MAADVNNNFEAVAASVDAVSTDLTAFKAIPKPPSIRVHDPLFDLGHEPVARAGYFLLRFLMPPIARPSSIIGSK